MPCAHRIVRIGKIHQFSPNAACFFQQSRQILSILFIGHFMQNPAEPADMVIEGWISAIRGHHGITRVDHHARQIAQEPIYAFSHHNILRADFMMARQSPPQFETGRISIFPNLGAGDLQRCDGLRRWAKHVFIGAKARIERAATRAFLGFGANERNACRQL